MIKSKRKITAVLVATFVLLALGVVGFAQRHFMVITPRPDVKMQLSAAVERNSEMVPLEKAAAVNPGEVLDWTITSENSGTASAFEYRAVAHIPRGTTFVAGTAKADTARRGFDAVPRRNLGAAQRKTPRRDISGGRRANGPGELLYEMASRQAGQLSQHRRAPAESRLVMDGHQAGVEGRVGEPSQKPRADPAHVYRTSDGENDDDFAEAFLDGPPAATAVFDLHRQRIRQPSHLRLLRQCKHQFLGQGANQRVGNAAKIDLGRNEDGKCRVAGNASENSDNDVRGALAVIP